MSQSQRLHHQHLWALVWPAAMLRRLESLLSHFEECLWLSLEGSSQGWRKAGRAGQGWRWGRKEVGEGREWWFVFLSHLWHDCKGGEAEDQSQWGDVARTVWKSEMKLYMTGCCLSLRLPGNTIFSWCQINSEGILKKGQQTFLECLISDRLLKHFFEWQQLQVYMEFLCVCVSFKIRYGNLTVSILPVIDNFKKNFNLEFN